MSSTVETDLVVGCHLMNWSEAPDRAELVKGQTFGSNPRLAGLAVKHWGYGYGGSKSLGVLHVVSSCNTS